MYFMDAFNMTYRRYEPAELTVHPPPPKMIEGGFIFSHRCLVPSKFFPKEKVDFVGDSRIRTHKTVVLRHNHSNPISTRLTLFDNNEHLIILQVSLRRRNCIINVVIYLTVMKK